MTTIETKALESRLREIIEDHKAPYGYHEFDLYHFGGKYNVWQLDISENSEGRKNWTATPFFRLEYGQELLRKLDNLDGVYYEVDKFTPDAPVSSNRIWFYLNPEPKNEAPVWVLKKRGEIVCAVAKILDAELIGHDLERAPVYGSRCTLRTAGGQKFKFWWKMDGKISIEPQYPTCHGVKLPMVNKEIYSEASPEQIAKLVQDLDYRDYLKAVERHTSEIEIAKQTRCNTLVSVENTLKTHRFNPSYGYDYKLFTNKGGACFEFRPVDEKKPRAQITVSLKLKTKRAIDAFFDFWNAKEYLSENWKIETQDSQIHFHIEDTGFSVVDDLVRFVNNAKDTQEW